MCESATEVVTVRLSDQIKCSISSDEWNTLESPGATPCKPQPTRPPPLPARAPRIFSAALRPPASPPPSLPPTTSPAVHISCIAEVTVPWSWGWQSGKCLLKDLQSEKRVFMHTHSCPLTSKFGQSKVRHTRQRQPQPTPPYPTLPDCTQIYQPYQKLLHPGPYIPDPTQITQPQVLGPTLPYPELLAKTILALPERSTPGVGARCY